ncbi:enterobactin synthase subunit F [Vibrio harveyi]|uniref:enterobactin synthase subunit F n=1 Tax=Vibrio harveyi TaxID=669 RepID=UPI00039CF112|nr:enterobactin synthase subunit F [Vibrio harveyi]MBY7700616.1 enterobactin synthase subunit F [Vibrio harveyi]PNM53758.1 non-ribosomal peptide synthetase [Vibrio harveyi]UIL60067.1 enterobactin synthase subunit F [Vibrio harveyi]SQA39567.1 enterobactin synthase [Vibrio harveyi]
MYDLPYTAEQLLPLTDAQAGIWFAQLRDPENPIYKTGEYLVIEGEVDEPCFVEAVKTAIYEVDSLHAKFVTTTEGPRMVIDRQTWQVERIDFSQHVKPLDAAVTWMKDQLKQPVDLEQGPLFIMALLKLSDDQYVWFLSLHHIAIDGYSMSLVAGRVAHVYGQLVKGEHFEKLEFADQQALLKEDDDYKASEKYQKDRAFYLQRYADHSDTVNLAGKPTVTSDHFLRLKGAMAASDFQRMESLAKQCRTHWYSVLIASIAAYVHRMTRSNEVVIGVPLMGRLGSVAIQTPAMRVNILPVRVSFESGLDIKTLVKQVNQEFASVRRHQSYRYEELHRELNLVKDHRNLFGPLVNIMPFEYEHKFGDLTSKAHNLSAGPVDDISFYCYELAGQLHIDMDANPELYSEKEIHEHQQRLFHFMSDFFTSAEAQDPSHCQVSDVSILLAGEREKVVETWNDTAREVPETTLSAIMARQRILTPHAPALIFEGQKLSYEQLARKVYSLTNWLTAQGVELGDRIAVCVPRSEELIVVQQAILAAGAVYVPVDPDYPEGRIHYMLESSSPKFVFSTKTLQDKLPQEVDVKLVDDETLPTIYKVVEPLPPQVKPEPHSPAYMIYTSGSTGKPKGVVVTHDAIVNRLLWMHDQYPIDAKDRVLQKTPAGFDVSVWEFFWPMMVGSCLVIAKPDGHKDPIYLQDLIHKEQITTLHFVPSMLQIFVQQADARLCQSLRQVFCSGEALPMELVNHYYQEFDAPLHNLYGPTEAAVDVTYWPSEANTQGNSIPIGRPVWNTQIYILDDELNPVPPGVVGNLYIAGRQLALGYHGQPELTQERFIDNPFGPQGSRMYLSGDLARWREDGAIEYCGRSDFQVKIRGFRIELEEIENALANHPSVAQVAVLAQEYTENDKRLVAYVSAEDLEQGIDTNALQKYLAEPLPDYMVPSYFVELESFPLTPNGKLDRDALPKPDLSAQVSTKGPSNLVEERLCKLFCRLLDLPAVGVDDNFFELGGHSLLAAQLIAHVKEIMGIELSLAAVFESPTVSGIAAKLNGSESDEALNILLPLRKREGKPAIFCVHPAGGLSWCYAALTPIIPSNVPLYGVQAKNLGDPSSPLPKSMTEMAEDYVAAIREEQPFGPYHLLGWSIGGMIAHLMAGILQQQGQEVGLVTLLDSYPTEQWQSMHPPGEEKALGALIRMAGVEFDESLHSSLTRPEVIDILQDAGSSMAHLSAETITAMVEVVINNNHRVRDSVDYQYQGDVLFFNAEKPPEEAFLDRNGWFKYMDGELKVIDVACIHREMMRPDMLRLIGSHMVEELRERFDV